MVAKKARIAAAEGSGRQEVDRAIERMRELQSELKKVNSRANKEQMKIERKYNKIRDRVYARRNDIISCIPDFWLRIILHHSVLEIMFTEYDREVFGYLDSLTVEDFQDPRKGYYVTFTFKPNPYFYNTKLTKTIKLFDDGTLKSVGSGIFWKQGKKPKGESNGRIGGNKRPVRWQSFFNWFGHPLVEMDEDVVAEIIKEELWPNPIAHLTNEEDELDDTEEDEDEESDGEDDGEESDGTGGGVA
ncbi:hypothetical protein ACS0TY_028363 [Phlomoides rotata]